MKFCTKCLDSKQPEDFHRNRRSKAYLDTWSDMRIKRRSGVPMVFCSVDYNALELATLAQCCLWTVGRSHMAEAINEGKDLHSVLGAQMVGRSYDEFRLEVKAKHPSFTNYRFAAKAGNFGFG